MGSSYFGNVQIHSLELYIVHLLSTCAAHQVHRPAAPLHKRRVEVVRGSRFLRLNVRIVPEVVRYTALRAILHCTDERLDLLFSIFIYCIVGLLDLAQEMLPLGAARGKTCTSPKFATCHQTGQHVTLIP